MSAAKFLDHTPRPWIVQGARSSDQTWLVGQNGQKPVAYVRGMDNAALVSAAPDLLAFVEEARDIIADFSEQYRQEFGEKPNQEFLDRVDVILGPTPQAPDND